jgi:hypothetical protein
MVFPLIHKVIMGRSYSSYRNTSTRIAYAVGLGFEYPFFVSQLERLARNNGQ